LSLSERSGLKYFTAVALIGLAFFHYRRGQRRAWTGYLNRALALAQQNGYDYLFESSCRSGMVEMYFDGLKTCSRGDYLKQVVGRCDAATAVNLMQSPDSSVRTAARRVYDSVAARYRHHLRITTGGQLKVYLPGGQEFPVRWYAQRHKTLFEFLATHPGWHAREKLVEHAWPGSAARTGFQNLRSAVARINQAFPFLPKLIARIMHSYGISPDYRIAADYLEFLALMQTAPPSSKADRGTICDKLKVAVELAPVSFLEDNYSSWAQECRESVHSAFVAALAELTEHYVQIGVGPEALEYARRLVHQEPFVEKYYHLLFKASALAGDRSAVETAYGRMCELFRKELQREPSAETAALCRKLTGPSQTD
jgi:DNA-binding SARP family transcriptional activator